VTNDHARNHADDDAEMLETSPDRPSKTQRKNEALALTDLGRRLVELKPQQLAAIPLPEDVARAVRDARAFNSHGARKRQLQYLGKLLRQIDVGAIQAALDRALAPGRHEAALAKQAEHWREQLLTQGDEALSEFLAACPQADRQHLRQLMRQCAQLGAESTRGKHAYRTLYREIHRQLGQHAATAS